MEFPAFAKVFLGALKPLIQLYFTIPLAGFLLFLGVYFGIVNNQRSFTRYVRFNALQAIILDICLSLPTIIEYVFKPPTAGIAFQMYASAYSAIWIVVLASVAYCMAMCFMGNTPRLPFLSEASDHQLP
mmetsp:Transcript_16834/g.40049  ORF Transcript_16834/g.40049 Transcript_16834/m.40049 type:complete len:129 (-) Transcript_16834:1038-1424(-)